MIKDPERFKKFENAFIRDEGKLPFNQSIKLFTSMWYEGVKLGILPCSEPLEGIDVDIKIARVLNSCLKSSCPE